MRGWSKPRSCRLLHSADAVRAVALVVVGVVDRAGGDQVLGGGLVDEAAVGAAQHAVQVDVVRARAPGVLWITRLAPS